MKRLVVFLSYILVLLVFIVPNEGFAQSVRQERKLITEGNKLYVGRKFKEAAIKYEEALKTNAGSAEARYNLGLAQIRQVVNPKDTTPRNVQLLENARKNLSEVASMARTKPGLAAKANYNLGNLEFNSENLKEAINFYKQALRIDPADNNARKNLRIAQLKQQQDQNQDKNQDQQQNQQDQQQDNKDQQNQNQDKDKNNQDNQNNDRQDRNKPQEKSINEQTASQILQAIDNKENQTRARVNRANKGEKSKGGGSRVKKW